MIVNLVYLAKPTRGGWPTYTAHVAHGLQQAGHSVRLWRIGRRTQVTLRTFGRGISYRLATPEFLAEVARTERMHITATDAKAFATVDMLLRAGASITIHDPTEIKGGMSKALSESKTPLVIIRNAMQAHFHWEGVAARYVPHPYMRMAPGPDPSRERGFAAAFSRLDWDKGTQHIVAANMKLPQEQQVQLYGAENRLFTHHRLAELDPDWRRNYAGQWPTNDLWGGGRIASGYRTAVDMSAIKGDGGGTQYTFLEALDAGCGLVLSRSWLVSSYPASNEMAPYATFVDPDKLTETLRDGVATKDASALFAEHDVKARALETVGIA